MPHRGERSVYPAGTEVINAASERFSEAVVQRARNQAGRGLPAVAQWCAAGSCRRGSERDAAMWANFLAENNSST